MTFVRRTRLHAPDPDTPWRQAEFCVFDVETTGLNLRRDEIVSYGASIVSKARIHCGRVAYRRVRPSRSISVGSMAIHNLRAADLADEPTIDEVIDEVTDLLQHRVLVAHAAWVEQAFLDRVLRRHGLRLGSAVIDTAALVRAHGLADTPPPSEPNLEAVARSLSLPIHTPHHALGDAFTTAQLFLVLASRLESGAADHDPLTVRRLCAVSRRNRS